MYVLLQSSSGLRRPPFVDLRYLRYLYLRWRLTAEGCKLASKLETFTRSTFTCTCNECKVELYLKGPRTSSTSRNFFHLMGPPCVLLYRKGRGPCNLQLARRSVPGVMSAQNQWQVEPWRPASSNALTAPQEVDPRNSESSFPGKRTLKRTRWYTIVGAKRLCLIASN